MDESTLKPVLTKQKQLMYERAIQEGLFGPEIGDDSYPYSTREEYLYFMEQGERDIAMGLKTEYANLVHVLRQRLTSINQKALAKVLDENPLELLAMRNPKLYGNKY